MRLNVYSFRIIYNPFTSSTTYWNVIVINRTVSTMLPFRLFILITFNAFPVSCQSKSFLAFKTSCNFSEDSIRDKLNLVKAASIEFAFSISI